MRIILTIKNAWGRFFFKYYIHTKVQTQNLPDMTTLGVIGMAISFNSAVS